MAREQRPIVFLGTPPAAALALRSLVAAGFDVRHVVTRADARRGRGGATSPSPVKAAALELGIGVSHDLDWVKAHADHGLLGVVVAYGRLIPVAVLDRVPMVNIHYSLLPRWRGAAPVERAIMAGDRETGVCIMDIEPTLDTGAVYARAVVTIRSDHTTETLTSELAVTGAELLVRTLDLGLGVPEPQSGPATHAAKIGPDDQRIDWTAPAVDIDRRVRAVRAHTVVGGQRLRVIAVETGHVSALSPGGFDAEGVVATGDGALRLVTVQPEGRQAMDASAWLRGRQTGAPLRFD